MRVSILMLLAVLGASQVPSLAAGSDDAPSSRSTQVAAATETGLDAHGHLQRVGARTDGAFGYTRLQAGVQIQVGGITKNVLFHGPDIVRVNANHGRNHWTAPSLVVVDVPPEVSFDLAEDARTLTLTSDRLVVNGSLGDHGIAVMAARNDLALQIPVQSDAAPLNGLVEAMFAAAPGLHWLRDATRGGLATIANEFAREGRFGLVLDEAALPVADAVRGACEILGLDILYLANEGKLAALVPAAEADAE